MFRAELIAPSFVDLISKQSETEWRCNHVLVVYWIAYKDRVLPYAVLVCSLFLCFRCLEYIIKTIVLLKWSPSGLGPKRDPVLADSALLIWSRSSARRFNVFVHILTSLLHLQSTEEISANFPLSHMNALPSMTYTLAFYPVSYNRDIWLLQSYCWEFE